MSIEPINNSVTAPSTPINIEAPSEKQSTNPTTVPLESQIDTSPSSESRSFDYSSDTINSPINPQNIPANESTEQLNSGPNLFGLGGASSSQTTTTVPTFFSSQSPENILSTINSLSTGLNSSQINVSSSTLQTANAEFGIAATLTGKLTNPNSTESPTAIRQQIQASVAQGYSTIFAELLQNPQELESILSTTHSPEESKAIAGLVSAANQKAIPLPSNLKAILGALASNSTQTINLQTLPSENVANLLGAFAAATQNTQLQELIYSAKSSEDSSTIDTGKIESAIGNLKNVTDQIQKQEKSEEKKVQNPFLAHFILGLECVAIVVSIAVLTVATGLTGGALAPATVAVSALLIGVMAASIAAQASGNAQDAPLTALTSELAVGLQEGLSDMHIPCSKEVATILASVIILVLATASGDFSEDADLAATDASSAAEESSAATESASALPATTSSLDETTASMTALLSPANVTLLAKVNDIIQLAGGALVTAASSTPASSSTQSNEAPSNTSGNLPAGTYSNTENINGNIAPLTASATVPTGIDPGTGNITKTPPSSSDIRANIEASTTTPEGTRISNLNLGDPESVNPAPSSLLEGFKRLHPRALPELVASIKTTLTNSPQLMNLHTELTSALEKAETQNIEATQSNPC